ncbi:MAG: zinc-binding alcohol dehydrogenase family protein [Candidatus Parvarchaeum acidiphilum ARMAN-4]|jgi:propanol-preferring alcohol dehydrogenase|uniref:Zinc-binding alcohol dehydrogenase family protein n=1 Tax=Candidatus Parvarchaeum acidiphilum ARMAN-4 TaxID=662760 RepID=D2EFE0_PARA4|nr:MAG: zinc-binding alcohol dehydrogenase family protein [Candidatus Parvarchaeum acidiphilum ARMAN-4]
MKTKAAFIEKPEKIEENPLKIKEFELPELRENEVLIKVNACGVCRTDLHVVEGELGEIKNIVPGHEVVGTIEKVGKEVSAQKIGKKVGVAWLYSSCGSCEYCLSGRENLCQNKQFTGFSRNGGYSEYIIADNRFIFDLPKGLKDEEIAPLLCSGAIGYRSFKLTNSSPGSTIAMFGFGGSAHLTLQLAKKLGHKVIIISRNENHLKLASELGADFTFSPKNGDVYENLKDKDIEDAIIFAPSATPIMNALKVIKPGGRVVVAGIHIDGEIKIDYDSQLFHEKTLLSVESYTREDMLEYLKLATNLGIKPVYADIKLEDVNSALTELKNSEVMGVKVIKF